VQYGPSAIRSDDVFKKVVKLLVEKGHITLNGPDTRLTDMAGKRAARRISWRLLTA